MTDCLDLFLQRKLPYFFAEPVLLALFLVELRWLLALRGKGAGTLAFYVWQYASTLTLYSITLLFHIVRALGIHTRGDGLSYGL